MVPETSSEDFFGRIFMVLDASGNFHRAGNFSWRFSRCSRLLWRDFHGAGDFFGGIFTALETSSGEFHSAGDCFGGIFTVLKTSSGDFKVCESSDSIEAIFKVLETFPW